MGLAWYVISSTLSCVLSILLVLFFIRAVLSWFSPMPSNKFEIFIHDVTEFIIDPIRRLLSGFAFVRECPIDIPFIVAVLLISLLQRLV